jgi:F-type H+-transporting ATPase subunit b
MPQLDPSSFPTQLFWLVVCFAVLYLVMWKVALPKIADVLRERQERIDGDLEKAEALKAEAEQVLESYQQALADGRAEAQTILREARDRTAAESATRLDELTARLARETADAESRIAAAKADALENVRNVASETAQAAASRLTGRDIDSATADAAVGAVMQERA